MENNAEKLELNEKEILFIKNLISKELKVKRGDLLNKIGKGFVKFGFEDLKEENIFLEDLLKKL